VSDAQAAKRMPCQRLIAGDHRYPGLGFQILDQAGGPDRRATNQAGVGHRPGGRGSDLPPDRIEGDASHVGVAFDAGGNPVSGAVWMIASIACASVRGRFGANWPNFAVCSGRRNPKKPATAQAPAADAPAWG